MRIIESNQIIDVVERLCIEAACNLDEGIYNAIQQAASDEEELGAEVLNTLLKNADLAKAKQVAMCQDTGMTVVFVEIGQQVTISDGLLSDAINEGVRRGYQNGYLRKSVVADPINRINTNDNTPAIIHYNIVGGNQLKITVIPKGFGSENMSAIKMLSPSGGLEGVMDFVIDVIKKGGQNACPPLIIGVGVGGTMEKAAILAKTALLRPIDKPNDDEFWNEIENELKKRINELGIGPGGLGGATTALSVNIETYPTHIAGLPVAVNLNCHAARHAEAII